MLFPALGVFDDLEVPFPDLLGKMGLRSGGGVGKEGSYVGSGVVGKRPPGGVGSNVDVGSIVGEKVLVDVNEAMGKTYITMQQQKSGIAKLTARALAPKLE